MRLLRPEDLTFVKILKEDTKRLKYNARDTRTRPGIGWAPVADILQLPMHPSAQHFYIMLYSEADRALELAAPMSVLKILARGAPQEWITDVAFPFFERLGLLKVLKRGSWTEPWELKIADLMTTDWAALKQRFNREGAREQTRKAAKAGIHGHSALFPRKGKA